MSLSARQGNYIQVSFILECFWHSGSCWCTRQGRGIPDDTRYQIIVLHSSSGFPFQHHTALTVIPSQISVPFRECTGPSKARAVLFGCNLDLFLSCV